MKKSLGSLVILPRKEGTVKKVIGSLVILAVLAFPIQTVLGADSELQKTQKALTACNAILGLLLTVMLMVSQQFLTKDLDGAFAWLITFWLILVEGHIISRAAQLHRVTGIAIAVVIFILQLGFYFTFGVFPEGPVA